MASLMVVFGVFNGMAVGQMNDHTLPAGENPVQAVNAFLSAVAKGDADLAAKRIAATNEQERQLRPGLAGVCAAVGDFDRAMVATFKTKAAGQWGVSPADMPTPRDSPDPAHGDRATVTFDRPTGKIELPMVKDAGQWRLSFGAVAVLLRLRKVEASPPPDEPLRRFTEMTEALKTVTADVTAGQFATADAAGAAGRAAIEDAARGKNAQ